MPETILFKDVAGYRRQLAKEAAGFIDRENLWSPPSQVSPRSAWMRRTDGGPAFRPPLVASRRFLLDGMPVLYPTVPLQVSEPPLIVLSGPIRRDKVVTLVVSGRRMWNFWGRKRSPKKRETRRLGARLLLHRHRPTRVGSGKRSSSKTKNNLELPEDCRVCAPFSVLRVEFHLGTRLEDLGISVAAALSPQASLSLTCRTWSHRLGPSVFTGNLPPIQIEGRSPESSSSLVVGLRYGSIQRFRSRAMSLIG